MPLRMKLSYGPALGDDSVTRYRHDSHRNGLPVQRWPIKIQPEVSAVATSTVSSTLPPASSVERTFHLPATSASEIVAAIAGAVVAVSTAVPSPAARFSDWAQPARTAAHQNRVRHRILPAGLGIAP